MRGYELTLVLNPEIEEEGVSSILDKIEAMIAKGDGKVVEIDRWGLRKLAYPISKKKEGYYVLMKFDVRPQILNEIDRFFKLSTDVLRSMIVKREKSGKSE